MKSFYILCLICFACVSNSFAQYTLSGTLVDASNGATQPFANIILSDTSKNQLAVATSDANGLFTLTVANKGLYIILIKQFGFLDFRRKIFVSENKQLGTISLIAADKALKEVQVTIEKNMIQNGAEKKVINIDKNIASQGGTAADILQSLPGVSVDNDEKIQMRGSSNLQILIDGKPTGARGSNINAILDQIPAAAIESIEIMNNPSAKFDPEGTGGIINIILKKNKNLGINGNVAVTVGTRNKYSSSAALNYKNKFFNMSSSIAFSNNYNRTRGELHSKNFPLDTLFYQYNKTSGTTRPLNILPKLGFDFYLNKFNTLSISSSYTYNNNMEKSGLYRQFSDMDSIQSSYAHRDGITNTTNHYGDVSLSYTKSFKNPKQELYATLYYQRGIESNTLVAKEVNTGLRDDLILPPSFSDSVLTNVSINTGLAQINYTHPFKNKSYIETGYSMRYNNANRKLDYYRLYSTGSWTNDSNKTNQFNYTENIQALYITYNGAFEKLSYKIGLRAEETLGDGVLLNNNQKVRNHYFKLFPSIFINSNLGKNRSLHFSYARRIQRPSLGALNPFADYSDPRNIRSGNPFLQPEMTHSFDLGIDFPKEKFTYGFSVYYRLQTNSIVFSRQVDENGIGTVTSKNIGIAHNYGIEYSSRYTPYKWWNLSLDLNAGGQTYDDPHFANLLNKQNYSYGGNFTSNWTIKKFWVISCSYNYNSPRRFPQGQMRAMHGGEIGMKFMLLKGKLILNTRLSDIFNTRYFAAKSAGDTFYSDFYRKRDTRNVYVGITYKFGQADKGSRPNKKDNGDTAPQNNTIEMF